MVINLRIRVSKAPSSLSTIWEDHISSAVAREEHRQGKNLTGPPPRKKHHREALPEGWAKYIHFKGHAYYVHAALRLVTPDDMEEPNKRRSVLRIRDMYLEECEDARLLEKMPEDWQLVIDCNEVLPWFVSHRERRMICVDPFRDTDIPHERDAMAYWFEVSEFPMHITELPRGAEHEFITTLADEVIPVVVTEEHGCEEVVMHEETRRTLQAYAQFKQVAEADITAVPVLVYFMARTIIETNIKHLGYPVSPRSAQSWQDKSAGDDWTEGFVLTAFEDLCFPIEGDDGDGTTN